MASSVVVFRSIPALAGEPATLRQANLALMGLSPRLRGNPRRSVTKLRKKRSIPALAGEPPFFTTPDKARAVYPRACGGTQSSSRSLTDGWGLSPRLRGNLREPPPPRFLRRSIPALAGEPRRRLSEPSRSEVYPRACGGTSPLDLKPSDSAGLSPRLRGNLLIAHVDLEILGSIPALAGEPSLSSTCWAHRRVYPRACGGTLASSAIPPGMSGLSPRLRGNPIVLTSVSVVSGSIPALAGEPP